MEEERRLCYVGMTRARQELHMLYAHGRLLYGTTQHNVPSRFLSEIDGQFQQSNASLGYGDASVQPFEFAAPSIDETRYVPDLTQGDRVRHGVFGEGTIMEMDGDNAAVYFTRLGSMKKLNVSFAPLEKL
jgi:DNA helicase-2/ATP-dependent DNA helicase PcrA